MNARDTKTFQEYKIDMEAIAEDIRFENQENARKSWAQANGNDSGFDPYWNIED